MCGTWQRLSCGALPTHERLFCRKCCSPTNALESARARRHLATAGEARPLVAAIEAGSRRLIDRPPAARGSSSKTLRTRCARTSSRSTDAGLSSPQSGPASTPRPPCAGCYVPHAVRRPKSTQGPDGPATTSASASVDWPAASSPSLIRPIRNLSSPRGSAPDRVALMHGPTTWNGTCVSRWAPHVLPMRG